MATQNDKIERLKKRLETVEGKIKALNAERASLREEITATENAQIVDMIRSATNGGDQLDLSLAADFAAFMREREATQSKEASASGDTE